MISGFAATGGAVGAAVGDGVAVGDATGVVGVAADDDEALGLDGASELVGPPIDVVGLDPGAVQAARTDNATTTTKKRTDACCFTSSLAL